jgi:hypothetical protein
MPKQGMPVNSAVARMLEFYNTAAQRSDRARELSVREPAGMNSAVLKLKVIAVEAPQVRH